jgi:UDP-glucose 4-epimerase
MRILVTGGFGYIGGRVSDYLLSKGYHVIIASRNSSGYFHGLAGAEIVHISWEKPRDLERACRKVDLIIHAAGMSAQDCEEHPIKALNFNGYSTGNLVNAAVKLGVKRFIYLSTAHVYSNPLTGVIKEGNSLINMHPYATSHVEGEKFVLAASKHKLIEGIVLRLSNVVGRPNHKLVNCWGLLVPNLCRQAVVEKKIELYGNGNSQRDFIAIGEVCRIIENLMLIPYKVEHTAILNLGTGLAKTLIDVAQEIQGRCINILGYSPNIIAQMKDTCDEDLSYRVDKIETLLGKVRLNITSEIDELLNFCRINF